MCESSCGLLASPSSRCHRRRLWTEAQSEHCGASALSVTAKVHPLLLWQPIPQESAMTGPQQQDVPSTHWCLQHVRNQQHQTALQEAPLKPCLRSNADQTLGRWQQDSSSMKQQQEHQLDPKNPEENHRRQTGRTVFRGGCCPRWCLKSRLWNLLFPGGWGEGI